MPHVPATNPLARIRLQLPLGLLLAGLLPYLVRTHIMDSGAVLPAVDATLVVVLCAITLGFYFHRSLSIFPGINSAFYVAPTFGLGYLLAAVAMLVLRLDYSRALLFSSLIVCILFFTLMLMLVRSRPRIGVVPGGKVGDLAVITSVDWVELRSPGEHLPSLHGIVADFRADLSQEWERFLADCALRGLVVYHVKQLSESLTGRVDVEHLSENNFGSLLPLTAYLRVKMIIDVIGAILALPVVLMFLGMVAIVVKIDSPGPIIFRQRRVGYRGELFTVYKIRTMTHARSAHPDDARTAAMTRDGDLRVTRVGRYLRRMRIDELPQVFNVLKGEMSWIGPRPEAEALADWYERELPFYHYRHVVRPGITGWAQVNQGHVAEVQEVREKLQNDFYYLKFFSPWLDVLIVIRTIGAVVTGFGSR